MRISDWSSDVCSSDLQEQTDASFQPPLETGGGDQPLGEGSGFAARLPLAAADLDAGLVASGLLATGTLGGVAASGFGLLALAARFTFLLNRPVKGPEPPIQEPPKTLVYLIAIHRAIKGSGFAAGLTLAGADLDAGLVASGLLATGTLGGVEASGFGLLALDDSFTFLLDRPVEGPEPPIPEPPINVVYLIDISGSMDGSGDGTASSPSRLDLAKQTVLALNQQFIDAGVADRLTIKVIAFRADTDLSVIEANSTELDGADDGGLEALLNGLSASGGTQYEGPLRVAADWLREDVDPGAGITERHEESVNAIYLFSDGDEDYLPDRKSTRLNSSH